MFQRWQSGSLSLPAFAAVRNCTRLLSHTGSNVDTRHSSTHSRRHCWCLRSKAAIAILAINTILYLTYSLTVEAAFLEPSFNGSLIEIKQLYASTIALYWFSALRWLFYPVGGFLADVHCGRYHAITVSIVLIWWGIVIFWAGVKFLAITGHEEVVYTVPLGVIYCLLVLGGFSGFRSNIVQFGLDQLQEAPSEELSVFLHWFVWTGTVGRLLAALLANTVVCFHHLSKQFTNTIILSFVPEIILIMFSIIISLSYNRKNWFNVEPRVSNPYKKVVSVIYFAWKHKHPLQRSAFTYCEDEEPSRIDFGKTKYGGPFTTEEVEDVKTFLRIVGLLLCIGPIFTIEFTTLYLFPYFGLHFGTLHNASFELLYCKRPQWFLLQSGNSSLLLTAIVLPIYITIQFSFFRRRVPTILSRLTVGIAASALGIISMLLIDGTGHYITDTGKCIFMTGPSDGDHQLHIQTYLGLPSVVLILSNILNGIGPPLVMITVLEFISAQSPYSMKGVLVGVFYAIKGLFLLLGNITAMPFILGYKDNTNKKGLACDTGYLLLTAFIATAGFVLYVVAAKRYKYRQRQEEPYSQRYAVEYWSNAGGEEGDTCERDNC